MATSEPNPLIHLPPGARFCVRVLARRPAVRIELDELARLLRAPRSDVEKHLRVAARALGAAPCAPGSDGSAWHAALGAALVGASTNWDRAPSTRCPAASVLRAVAHGELDGPLLLAQLDHLADCTPCLDGVLAPDTLPADTPRDAPHDKTGCLGVLLVLALVLTGAAALV